MDKIIIYGLGNAYEKIKDYLYKHYEVVACCDKNIKGNDIIHPKLICTMEYDYIYITSSKYFAEISEELINTYNVSKDKILGVQNIFGDFRNEEIRDKWVIEKLLNIPKDKVILDAGAGESKYQKYCTHLKYIAQDFGEYIPNETITGMQFAQWDYSGINIKCDIIDIPLEDSSVDAILCTEVFEHISNPVLALKEFSRLLSVGGTLILTAPFCCLTHMAPYFFYNGFSDYWYEEHLKQSGFKIVDKVNYGSFFKYLQQEVLRLNEVCERYSKSAMTSEELDTVWQVMKILSKYADSDTGSDELLRFGTMIMAEKL